MTIPNATYHSLPSGMVWCVKYDDISALQYATQVVATPTSFTAGNLISDIAAPLADFHIDIGKTLGIKRVVIDVQHMKTVTPFVPAVPESFPGAMDGTAAIPGVYQKHREQITFKENEFLLLNLMFDANRVNRTADAAASPLGSFDPTRLYFQGEIINAATGPDDPIYFYSLKGGNLNHEPFTSPTWWSTLDLAQIRAGMFVFQPMLFFLKHDEDELVSGSYFGTFVNIHAGYTPYKHLLHPTDGDIAKNERAPTSTGRLGQGFVGIVFEFTDFVNPLIHNVWQVIQLDPVPNFRNRVDIPFNASFNDLCHFGHSVVRFSYESDSTAVADLPNRGLQDAEYNLHYVVDGSAVPDIDYDRRFPFAALGATSAANGITRWGPIGPINTTQLQNGAKSLLAISGWNSSTMYNQGDAAKILVGSATIETAFFSLQNSNLNHNPATSPDWWNVSKWGLNSGFSDQWFDPAVVIPQNQNQLYIGVEFRHDDDGSSILPEAMSGMST